MATQNLIQNKTFNFSLKIIDLFKQLNNQKEYIISKQLFRSGTSIGANIEEALQGQSKKDFIFKMSISLKEAFETRYWLKLLNESKLVTISNIKNYLEDINSIINILTKIIKTTKSNL